MFIYKCLKFGSNQFWIFGNFLATSFFFFLFDYLFRVIFFLLFVLLAIKIIINK